MTVKLTLRRLSGRWWVQSLAVASLATFCLTPSIETATTLTADASPAKTTTTPAAGVSGQSADDKAPVQSSMANQADETIDRWMPNKALQKVVLNDLKDDNSEQANRWQTPADITKDDMKLLKVLFDTKTAYVDGQHEYSLEGLQYATNLKRLAICGGINDPVHVNADVVDVTPLKDLQSLEEVDLQHNRIKDVSPLAGLKNVTSMALAMNYISDFSQLPTQQYTTFTYTGQLIELPPTQVDQATRKAHLKVTCKFKEDRPVELLAPKGIGRLADWNDAGPQYAMHFNGGTGTPDGQGGLHYTQIVDQAPGPTSLPNQNIFPLPDKFYLIGQDKEKTFNVVQPYRLATAGRPVTAKYQDETGKTIHDDVVFNGMLGEDYTTEQLAIEGYDFKEVKGAPTGKFGETEQTVTYVYTKTPQKAQPVTVKYQDETGKVIHEQRVFDGQVGDPYKTTQLEIEGYTFKRVEGKPVGKLTDTPQTVIYVYAKTEQDAQPVTVQYVADSGEEIAEAVVLTGKVGAEYAAQRLKITGYVWAETKGAPEKGTFKATAQTVTQVYSRIEGDSGVGNEGTNPGSDGPNPTPNPGNGGTNTPDQPGDSTGNLGQDNGSSTTTTGPGNHGSAVTHPAGGGGSTTQGGTTPGSGTDSEGSTPAPGITLPGHQPGHQPGGSLSPATTGETADDVVAATPGESGQAEPPHADWPTSVFNRPDAPTAGLVEKPAAAVASSHQDPTVSEGELPQTGEAIGWGKLAGLVMLGFLGLVWLWRRNWR